MSSALHPNTDRAILAWVLKTPVEEILERVSPFISATDTRVKTRIEDVIYVAKTRTTATVLSDVPGCGNKIRAYLFKAWSGRGKKQA